MSLLLALTGGVEPTVDTLSLGGKRLPSRRIRWQDYDVPLPEPALLPVPPEARLRPEPAAPISALAPKSILAKPRRAKTGAPVSRVAGDQPQPVEAVAPPIATPAPRLIRATPAAKLIRSAAVTDSMERDALLQAVKLLARIQMGPQLIRTTPRAKLIRQPVQ